MRNYSKVLLKLFIVNAFIAIVIIVCTWKSALKRKLMKRNSILNNFINNNNFEKDNQLNKNKIILQEIKQNFNHIFIYINKPTPQLKTDEVKLSPTNNKYNKIKKNYLSVLQYVTPSGYEEGRRRKILKVKKHCSFELSERKNSSEWLEINENREEDSEMGRKKEYLKTKSSASIYLYSAYLCEMNNSTFTIYLIGISRIRLSGGFCRVWNAQSLSQILVPVHVSNILSSYAYTYKELIFTCSFSANHLNNPTHVTIVSTECSIPPTSLVLIRVDCTKSDNEIKRDDYNEENMKVDMHEKSLIKDIEMQENNLEAIFNEKTTRNYKDTDKYDKIVREKSNNTDIDSNIKEDYDTLKYSRVDFTVCLSPLNNYYNNHQQLIEWFEANMLLGVNRFTVYNHSSGYEVGKVLDHYVEKGVVEVVQWEIPVEVRSLYVGMKKSMKVAYFAQLTALNDCLFRSKKTSRYIINVDLDEIIVPKNVKNYSELLKTQSGSSKVYSFRNVFFHLKSKKKNLKIKKENENLVGKFNLRMLSSLSRSSFVWKHKERSKMIISTEVNSPILIHDIYDSSINVCNIPSSQALLHHYRKALWNDVKEETMESDSSMLRFSDSLIYNVKKAYREFEFL